jgi:competence protein ComEA
VKKFAFAVFALLAFSSAAFARVNVNSATAEELEALKDVGPVKAKAIVEYRKKHGAFKSIDELSKVPGVGVVTLQKIKSELSVTDVAKPGSVKATASGLDKKSVTGAAKTPAAAPATSR